ncbi:MAG: arylamine N-acetyltransferase [Opitutaceae bacterium]|nr:arylamine N-acetyltransferase [Opitutaceae bacterium]
MSAAKSPDLDAYFARIGYTGSRMVSHATLDAIHRCHAETIPFENLDIQLGRRIAIDLASIERKLVQNRRGGYCFEQNTLLAAVLRALGFAVTMLLGRVRWQIPDDVQTPLVHAFLRVETPDAGLHLADVGFGSMTLYRPLRWQLDAPQPCGLEPRRLTRRGDSFAHQALIGEAWGDVYIFSPSAAPGIDLEVSNWFTCAHPESAFLKNLRASRTVADRRFTLLNAEFKIRHADGRVEQRTIATADELLVVLAEFFGLRFPPGTRFGQPGMPWPQ